MTMTNVNIFFPTYLANFRWSIRPNISNTNFVRFPCCCFFIFLIILQNFRHTNNFFLRFVANYRIGASVYVRLSDGKWYLATVITRNGDRYTVTLNDNQSTHTVSFDALLPRSFTNSSNQPEVIIPKKRRIVAINDESVIAPTQFGAAKKKRRTESKLRGILKKTNRRAASRVILKKKKSVKFGEWAIVNGYEYNEYGDKEKELQALQNFGSEQNTAKRMILTLMRKYGSDPKLTREIGKLLMMWTINPKSYPIGSKLKHLLMQRMKSTKWTGFRELTLPEYFRPGPDYYDYLADSSYDQGGLPYKYRAPFDSRDEIFKKNVESFENNWRTLTYASDSDAFLEYFKNARNYIPDTREVDIDEDEADADKNDDDDPLNDTRFP